MGVLCWCLTEREVREELQRQLSVVSASDGELDKGTSGDDKDRQSTSPRLVFIKGYDDYIIIMLM